MYDNFINEYTTIKPVDIVHKDQIQHILVVQMENSNAILLLLHCLSTISNTVFLLRLTPQYLLLPMNVGVGHNWNVTKKKLLTFVHHQNQ